jgi:C-8 sterol isomerase
MLPFGTLDTLFSTLDFVTLWQTVAVSAKGIVKNLLRGKV